MEIVIKRIFCSEVVEKFKIAVIFFLKKKDGFRIMKITISPQEYW